MSFQQLADQYRDQNELYKRLKLELEEVSKERTQMATQLMEAMDADAVSQVFCSDGRKVAVVSSIYGKVNDYQEFRRWVYDNGMQDSILKEVVVRRELNEVAKACAKKAGVYLGTLPSSHMPPGTDVDFKQHLRVTTPKNGEGGFKSAARSIIEQLE